MTRSVTIVNTSNWEHEDVEVVQYIGGWPEKTRLQPGDKLVLHHGAESVANIAMKGVRDKEPVPFKKEDGTQDLPRVEIYKPKGSGGAA